jgi:hypothetical protein
LFCDASKSSRRLDSLRPAISIALFWAPQLSKAHGGLMVLTAAIAAALIVVPGGA